MGDSSGDQLAQLQAATHRLGEATIRQFVAVGEELLIGSVERRRRDARADHRVDELVGAITGDALLALAARPLPREAATRAIEVVLICHDLEAISQRIVRLGQLVAGSEHPATHTSLAHLPFLVRSTADLLAAACRAACEDGHRFAQLVRAMGTAVGEAFAMVYQSIAGWAASEPASLASALQWLCLVRQLEGICQQAVAMGRRLCPSMHSVVAYETDSDDLAL